MSDFQPLLDYIKTFIELTKEEEAYFLSLLVLTKVKKRQFIVQPNFVCQHMNYVREGALRSYLVDNKGIEHTIALAIEGWWINDCNSYIFQEPATFFVQALENSVIIQLSYQSEQLLLANIPKFERFFRITARCEVATIQKRVLSNISQSAEQRYEDFAMRYPALLNRIPQYAIASYLGFTTEFLSKIRNKKLKKG
ncbi:Crp/Fnr family transcriptional regulator [Cytophagaceae bacterium DM2B3-1]|uniref:Crp/Fnr family transcriptional regulator n=1 Tax=Xanthocytophaga flava TaxID=3048013 RepID=A0ABT7CH38_9BACT|nr:Crp/Fnr family transcriptional regulator [Xanthocytophaga flavus]MDJ1472365.1 Crp/Fnr family transcriptional regulator [Xanthocytophaga flavus]MDJ1493063.1 Crp/Fnr family transcriptional regulator [Xanthocytophaga flavus]